MPDIAASSQYSPPVALVKAGQRFAFDGTHGSSDALLIARYHLAYREKVPLLAVVCESAVDAQRLSQEIGFFAPEARVRLLPDWETLPYDTFSPHQDLVSERLATLHDLGEGRCDILLVPATTALYRMPPASFLAAYTFSFSQGERLDEARAEGAADAGRLRAREPGGASRRILRARLAARPLSDGLAVAVPDRPVRRPGRFDPRVRSGHAAQPLPGERRAPAARPRISVRRSRAHRVPQPLARDLRGRSEPRVDLQGHRQRRAVGGHRILSAALLRGNGDAVPLPARRRATGVRRRSRRRDPALHQRHEAALQLPVARPRPADPGAAAAVPVGRGFLHVRQAVRAARAACQRGRRLVDAAAESRDRPSRGRSRAGVARVSGHHAEPRAVRRRIGGPARNAAAVARRQSSAARFERQLPGLAARRRALFAGRRAARQRLCRAGRRHRDHHRDRAVRSARAPRGAPPPGTGEQRRFDGARPVRAEGRRSGRAFAARHRPLYGSRHDGSRRRRDRVPAPRIRGRQQALRAGRAIARDLALQRRRSGKRAAALARLGPVGKGQAQGRAADSRYRRRVAEPVCPPRRARRATRSRSNRKTT